MVDEQAQILSLPTYEIHIQHPPPDAQINQMGRCFSKGGSFAYHGTTGCICLEIFWMSQLGDGEGSGLLLNSPQCTGRPHNKKSSVPNVNSAEAEKP